MKTSQKRKTRRKLNKTSDSKSHKMDTFGPYEPYIGGFDSFSQIERKRDNSKEIAGIL